MFPRTPPLTALSVLACLSLPLGLASAQEPEANSAEGSSCGGIAAFPCPEGYSCVDDPNDTCDPNAGGADCGGICTAADAESPEEGQKKPQCDYSDPNLRYVAKDPDQCAAIRFYCETGFEPFFNDCGCGCQPIAQ